MNVSGYSEFNSWRNQEPVRPLFGKTFVSRINTVGSRTRKDRKTWFDDECAQNTPSDPINFEIKIRKYCVCVPLAKHNSLIIL